jgi:hypothetical protein
MLSQKGLSGIGIRVAFLKGSYQDKMSMSLAEERNRYVFESV